jgi:type IV pilus assembly protein PilM
MRKEELDESIDFDIEQYLPFSILEAETDCLVSNFEAGHGQMDVLATAVKKALLASHTDIALKAGLRPVGANVGVLGAVKAYVQNHNPAQDKTSVILDIGANTTSLCWLNGHEVRFTRELKIGGNFANQEVVKAINCSLHQAEVYRKNPEAFDADMPEVVRTANNQFVETLATEVREALEFLKSCEIKANISDIYLCGGASQTEGLTEALSNRLGIVPCNLEPFRTLDIKTHGFDRAILDADGPFFAKAVGLALSGLKQ